MKMQIKVSIDRHYIGGDRVHVFLNIVDNSNSEHRVTGMPVILNKSLQELQSVYDNVNGLKTRLEMMGNEVEVFTKINDDPNFESEDAAAEYEMNGK